MQDKSSMYFVTRTFECVCVCVYCVSAQVITSNQTVFTTFLTPAQLGLANANNSLVDLFPSLVTDTPPNQYAYTDTNWGAQVFNTTENATHVTISYLCSVADIGACSAAGLPGCAPLTRIAVVLDGASVPGTNVSAAVLSNRDWEQPGVPPPAISVTNTGTTWAYNVQEGAGRQLGVNGPVSTMYTLAIPKLPGTGTVLPVTPNGLPSPPPCAYSMMSTTQVAVTSLGRPSDPAQAYNPTIFRNPTYAGSGNALPLNISGCLNSSVVRTSNGVNTTMSWVLTAATAVAGCRTVVNNALQRPLYVRVRLSPTAQAQLTARGAPGAGSELTPSPTTTQGFGGVITWSNVPFWGNVFTYNATFPGVQAINDICAQNQGAAQLPDTCVFELISGGNRTLWQGVAQQRPLTAIPPFPPAPATFPPPPGASPESSGLTYNEKLAIIICSVVGGILLILLLCLFCVFCYRRHREKWAPAKTVMMASGRSDEDSERRSGPGDSMTRSEGAGDSMTRQPGASMGSGVGSGSVSLAMHTRMREGLAALRMHTLSAHDRKPAPGGLRM